MAKRFGGFTPQQQQTLLSKMGYTGPAQQDDINKFMMSSPQASSMMGKYTQMAKARVSGGPRMAMNAGGLSQEEQMKMFNQANQNAMQMGTGNPQSSTYQTSLAPAATNQQPTQFATQVAPEQMAAQNSYTPTQQPTQFATQVTPEQMAAQNLANAAQNSYTPTQQSDTLIRAGQPSAQQTAMQPQMQEVPADVQQRLDRHRQDGERINQAMQERFGERGNADNYVPEFSSKMKALQDNMQATNSAFFTSKGIAEGDYSAISKYMQSNPNARQELDAALQADRQQADALSQQLENNPEFKAFQTEAKQYQQSLADNMLNTTGTGQQGQGNRAGIKGAGGGYATADMQPIYDDAGNIIGYGPSAYQPRDQISSPGERPISGPGTSQPSLYSGDVTNQTLQDILKMSTGAAPVDLQYDFNRDGKITSDDALQAGRVGVARGTVSEDTDAGGLYDPSQGLPTMVEEGADTSAKDRYNQQLEQYKQYQAGQAGAGLEDTRATLDAAQRSLSEEQNLSFKYAEQLSGMADDDPQRAVLEGLIDEQQLKVKNAKDNLSQAQSNLERVGMPSTTEMRATALEDPASMATKADVVTATDEQRAAGKIAEGTGQAATTAEQATVTTADTAADVVAPIAKEAETYDPTLVTDKAKAELDKVEAATLDEFSKGVIFEGEQGELSAGAYADEALKVATDRIQKVNEKLDLEVTKQQLAEVKGKNLKAIETKVAKSSALLDAVAAAHVVQPNELPTPQLIAEEDMAQAKAMTDSGLDKDAIPIAAKMASFSVDNGTLAKAAQGDVDSLATVEGQLGKLMKQFDDGTPAWAAGAIRAANAAMSSRGLGASSMAGAAILQAAMESALPIAQQDAKTYADMGMQNLDNRQQVAIANAAAQQGLQLQNLDNEQKANLQKSINAFGLQTQNLSNRQAAEVANAQIRSTLQGQNLSNMQTSNIAEAARYAEAANINLNNKQQAAMQDNSNALKTNLAELSAEQSAYINSANTAAALQGQVLSNEQQVSIANAARFSEAANIEFTAEQQNTLHNSKLMSSIGLAELSATQAATLQNAATVASMDITNLNNRQQAAVQNAKSFLQRDMTNLSNEQQTSLFKAQATQQALLSDQAAENAAKQFNAASENQTNQFYDNLTTQVALQNQEQTNAMNRFNAGEANAIAQSNAAQQNARDQFNANNALVVEQANAQWEQAITTMDNAAQNAANRDAAVVANGLTETTYNNMLQQERDAMDYAWRSAESALARENNLVLAGMQADSAASTAKGNAAGTIAAVAADYLLKKTFGVP